MVGYPHVREITTRWKDNDVYGHVNNVEYYSYFDTVINEYLIAEGGLDILAGETIGLCAESHCAFLGPLAFPGVVEAGLRVGTLGRSSVRYEIALRERGAGGAIVGAVGARNALVIAGLGPMIAALLGLAALRPRASRARRAAAAASP